MSRSLIIMACLSVGAEAIAKPGMKQLAERFQVGKLATKMLIGGDGSMIGTSGKQTKHTMAEKLDSQDDCDEHTKFKSGRKIGSKTTCTTFAECQKQCSETDDCTEMSWLKAKGWCKLYDGGVGKETEQDTWSGSRTCTLPAGVGGEPTGCPATTAAAGVATVCADSDVDIHVPTQYANTRKDKITCATAEEALYSFQELCAAAGDFGGIVRNQCRVKCGCCSPGEDDPDKDSAPAGTCRRLCQVDIDCPSPDTCQSGKCAAPPPQADDTQEEDAGDQGDNTQDEDAGDQGDNTQVKDGGDQADNTQNKDAGDQAEATPATTTTTTTSCHDNDGTGWVSKIEDDGEKRYIHCGTIRDAESTGNWVDSNFRNSQAIDPEKNSFKNSCKVTEEMKEKGEGAMARTIRSACVKSCGCCGQEEACKDDAIYARDIWPVAFP